MTSTKTSIRKKYDATYGNKRLEIIDLQLMVNRAQTSVLGYYQSVQEQATRIEICPDDCSCGLESVVTALIQTKNIINNCHTLKDRQEAMRNIKFR